MSKRAEKKISDYLERGANGARTGRNWTLGSNFTSTAINKPQKVSKSTMATYKRSLVALVRAYELETGADVADVTKIDKNWLKSHLTEESSKSKASNCCAALRRYAYQMRGQKHCLDDVLRYVHDYQQVANIGDGGKRRAYSDDEIEKIKNEITTCNYRADKLILALELMADFGCRSESVLSCDSVRVKNPTTISFTEKGNKKRHVVSLKDEISPEIKTFISSGGLGITYEGLRKCMKKICVKAGVGWLGLHGFRHHAYWKSCDYYFDLGFNAKESKNLASCRLGHSPDRKTRQAYGGRDR